MTLSVITQRDIGKAGLARHAIGHLRHAGLDVRELTGMTYNPITKVYKLGRDVDVNYLMHARDIREA